MTSNILTNGVEEIIIAGPILYRDTSFDLKPKFSNRTVITVIKKNKKSSKKELTKPRKLSQSTPPPVPPTLIT
jgi:hypothetical protein